jgi:hypothetical protein
MARLALVAPAVLLASLTCARTLEADPLVHLAWDDCGAAGTSVKTFACNTNAGTQTLVVSFVPPTGITQFIGITVHLSLLPADGDAASLPAWWNLATGGCRAGILNSSFDYSSAGPFHCANPWGSVPLGGIGSNPLGTITVIGAIPTVEAHALDPALEYYGPKIVVQNVKTSGAGACGGCSTPVGFYVGGVTLNQVSGSYSYEFDYRVPGVVPAVATWQCAGTPNLAFDFRYGYSLLGWDFPGCATPTRRPTWGGLKSLYR